MKSKPKNYLDEMQEAKLLKIEHNGCWLTFGLLAVVLLVQVAANSDWRVIAGESVVFTTQALYLLTACLKNGIWDRRLKPNFKTNMVISLIAGGTMGIFWFIVSYTRYHVLAGSLATFAFVFLFTCMASMAGLGAAAYFYKKRVTKLEEEEEKATNEP